MAYIASKRQFIITVGFVISVIGEIYFFSLNARYLANRLVPGGFILCGIVAAGMPLFYHKPFQWKQKWVYGFTVIVAYFFFAVIFIFRCNKLLSHHPIDYRIADMLPAIQTMASRFIHAQNPYAPLAQIWNGMQPIYLPAMWLPYCLPLLLNIDIRWLNVVALLAGILLIVMIPLFKKRVNALSLFMILYLIFLLKSFTITHRDILPNTEESIVYLYYILLAVLLTGKNYILQGVSIACCLLSRFSLLLWVPLYLLVVLGRFGRNDFFKVFLTVGVTIFTLMVLSNAFQYLPVFFHLPSLYLNAVTNPENSWKYGPLINTGLGITRFISVNQLQLLSKTTPWTLLLLNAALLLLFYFRKKQVDAELFLLCALKLNLVVFYSLLIIPYQYLFLTSVLITPVIALCFLNQEDKVQIKV